MVLVDREKYPSVNTKGLTQKRGPIKLFLILYGKSLQIMAWKPFDKL
jgi:hypothetical protein